MKSIVASTVGGLLLWAAQSPAQAAALTVENCTALKGFQAPGYALEITRAEPRAAANAPGAQPGAPPITVPAHCRVEGAIDARTGVDGKPYAIRFAVALPPEWNGRFLMQGGGGLNGTVGEPLGGVAAGGQTALARGFAVASTDSGHAGSTFDASFLADQEAAVNFLYQAVAKVTVVAKQVVAAYYGNAAHHAYFAGCSTGGREAMILSQRFPNYFDGIVAGAPAMRTNYSNLSLRWVSTALNAIAPKDAQGRPQTRLALSDADRKLLIDGLLAACDADDGARDGLVSAPQSCRFDPAVLACKGAKAEGCLSTAQVTAVKTAMAGPKTRSGRQVYPGFLYDTGIATTRGLPGPLAGPMIPEGPSSGTSMDVDAEEAVAHDARAMLGDTNAWTNLSTFRGRGGKLLFFHGVSDPWFSALDTIQYYQRLGQDNGPTPVADWSRLFLVPGMAHCAGGEKTLDNFDLLGPLVQWVEQGRAPDAVPATGSSMPGVSRPLCAWPRHAHYRSGDANAATSYDCRD